MRRGSACLFFLVVTATVVFGLDLTAFRQSYSRASRAYWAVTANASVGRETVSPAWQLGVLSGTVDWRTAILSDNLDLDADVYAYGLGGAQSNDAPDTLPEPGHDVSAGLALIPTATCHCYLLGTDGFVRAGLGTRGDIALRDVRDGAEREKRRLLGFNLRGAELGVGYGRMRDAWPLYRAVRLTRILEEEGVLVRELSDDDLRELGGFLSRSWKLFYAHERAAKFYYDSLEQWLMHAGAIDEPLPAYALFRLDETPLIGSDERRFGMRGFVVANATGWWQRNWFGVIDAPWTQVDTSSFNPSYRIGWEFAGLRGLRWCYGASAAYILPWPHLPDSGMRHRLVLSGSAAYDITDRLVASYGLDLEPLQQSPGTPNGASRLSLPAVQTAVFSYYLSERFAVRLGGRYETEFDHYYGQDYRRTEFSHRWSAALTMTFGRIPAGWVAHYYL
jgi:hypothetical protein